MNLRILAIPLVILTSCTITEKSRTQTGLFSDNLKKLSDAYETVEKMDREKATRKDVEAVGFDFNAPNVEQMPGPAAFRRIFSETVFQNALSKSTNTDQLLRDMRQYKAFFIPLKDITVRTDRWYFTTKNTFKNGDDLLILFLFKNDKLFYCDYRYVKIDSKDSSSAFAQGVIDFIKEFLGPTDAIYDLIDKLEENMKD